LKKLVPKHFFISLLSDLLTKDLVTLGNLFSTKSMKPRRRLYATLGQRAWVPLELRSKVFKQLMNHHLIRSALKPWDVYKSRKKNVLTNDRTTKIRLFPLHYGLGNLIKKNSNYANWEYNINLRKIKWGLTLNLKQIHSDCSNK
jgi:hypothetical protein